MTITGISGVPNLFVDILKANIIDTPQGVARESQIADEGWQKYHKEIMKTPQSLFFAVPFLTV